METNYVQKLRQALAKDLPALKCHIGLNDIYVTERPDGDYAVKVCVRITRVERPQGASFDTGPVVEETYTVDEALETKGDSYKSKTMRLAAAIRRKEAEKTP